MKIAIFGTSNSILRGGWVDGLRENIPGAEIENFSIGNSPGFSFGLYMSRDLSAYDVVFLDSTVNDTVQLKHGFIPDLDFLNGVMRQIMEIIRSQTRLICMGFPRFFDIAEEGTVYSSRRALCQEMGIPFIDMRQKVMERIEAGADPQSCFRPNDVEHVLPAIAFQAGAEIAENLPDLVAAGSAAVAPGKDLNAAFAVWRPGLCRPVRVFKNSLGRFPLCLLREGDRLEIDGFDGYKCIGLMVDAFRTNASIITHSDGRRYFYNAHFTPPPGLKDEDSGFEMRFLPTGRGIPARSIEITSILRAISADEYYNAPWSSRKADVQEADFRVNLHSILFWRDAG